MEEERTSPLDLVKWELFGVDEEDIVDPDASLPSHEWLDMMELRLGFGLARRA